MKIVELEIENFRAIRKAQFSNLGHTVVIAGPNGCGKSAVLDSIRLLKSACGEYRRGELQHFFSEFAIQAREGIFVADKLLRDPTIPLKISARFQLAAHENSILQRDAPRLLRPFILRELSPSAARDKPTLLRAEDDLTSKLEQRLADETAEFRALVSSTSEHVATVESEPGTGLLRYSTSDVLHVLFSTFEPEHLGIFDFHGSNRAYQREQVTQITFARPDQDTRSQHALYQIDNKYKNIKQEMASSYLREILAERAGVPPPGGTDLTSTLRGLFDVFCPGKEFLGPRATADGRLAFDVRFRSGAQHDIDDLSSSEKEILYGYLRLRDMAPQWSVLLSDEPELHLNPRMVRGLPEFYREYLGRPYENQIVLVTHSDAFLRRALAMEDFSVFHMRPADRPGGNQASRVEAKKEVERLVIELVGDSADYTPQGKVVILEGGQFDREGDNEFDKEMIRAIFSEFAEEVNLVSSGNVRKVQHLHQLLELIHEGRGKFFSITDSDLEVSGGGVAEERRMRWNVYGIENYLLEPQLIRQAMEDLGQTVTRFSNDREVDEALKEAGRGILETVVRERLEFEAKRALRESIRTGSNREEPISSGINVAVRASIERVLAEANKWRLERLERREQELRAEWEASFQSDDWRARLPGKEILKRFDGAHVGIRWEQLRHLVLAQMRNSGFIPLGMARVIHAIQDADVSLEAPTKDNKSGT